MRFEPKLTDLKIATLRAELDVLAYSVEDKYARLCEHADCPFGSGNTSFTFQFNVSDAYQGIAFNSRFVILNSADTANVLGCVEVETAPILKSFAWYPLVFCIFGIALFVGVSYLLTAYLNPWTGTKNVYLYSSNFGRDASVTRLITPGFFDFVKYLQFALFLTSLSLKYPAFLQPLVSTFSWSCLLFPSSIISENIGDLRDGLYYSNATYGLQRMGQVNQIAGPKNVWPTFIIYLLLLTAGVFLLCELVAGATWAWKKYREDTSDLRTRNVSFLVGLIFRIYLNLFALPILTFSFFQCVVTRDGPVYLTVLATLVILAWVTAAIWVSRVVIKTKPRQVIYDDLPTMLRFGTFYNTYNEQGAAFFTVELIATFLRGMTMGALQTSGLVQIILLAIIELFNFFCILIVKPFDRETSMNLISSLSSILRFILIFLSLPFLGSLDIDMVIRQWLGYSILIIHAIVFLLFLMHGLQVIVEVILRYNGVATDEMTGAIYSLKQLSRRQKNGDSIAMEDTKYRPAMLHHAVSHKPGSSMEGRGLLVSDDPNSSNRSTLPSAEGSTAVSSAANRDSTFEDVYVASPTSDNSFLVGTRDSVGYYRKPRRRNSSDNANLNQVLFGDVQDDGTQTKPQNENGEELNAMRIGIVSPPPAGVNYAVRESDVYYTKRAEPRKKNKRHHHGKHASTAGLEAGVVGNETGNGNPYDYKHFGSTEYDPSQSNRNSDYGGALGELATSGGVLTVSKHRSRNPNSMVGLLDGDRSSQLLDASDFGMTSPKEPQSSRFGGVMNWLKEKKKVLFFTGYEEPSIEPQGFEVFRRGPLRAHQAPSEYSGHSSDDNSVEEQDIQAAPIENTNLPSPERSHNNLTVVNSAERNLMSDSIATGNFTLGPLVNEQTPNPPLKPSILRPTIIHHRRDPSDSYVESNAGTFIFPTSPTTAPGTLSNPTSLQAGNFDPYLIKSSQPSSSSSPRNHNNY